MSAHLWLLKADQMIDHLSNHWAVFYCQQYIIIESSVQVQVHAINYP